VRLVFEYIRRTCWLFLLSVPFALAFPPLALLHERAAARLLRAYLQACGGGFVKLGQLLAMRYDLLTVAYQTQLAQLLDGMPAAPFARIRRIIERELGRPVGALFASIEPEPLGTASIAQVHGAVLESGDRVVIKVRRPGVEHEFAIDFFNLTMVARLLDLLGVLTRIDLPGLAREASTLVMHELDFRREARNAHRLWQLMQTDDIAHRSPRVHFNLSSATVMTMERLEGVWVKDILAAVVSGDEKALAAYRERGIEPENVGRLIFRSIAEQSYRHRCFHGDPHAGNLIVDERGWLGYIDFGQVGLLDERLAAQQFRIFDMLTSGRIHAAYEALLTTIEPLATRDLAAFESEVKLLFSDWLMAGTSDSTSAEKSAVRMLLSLGRAMHRAGLRMRWNVLRLYRVQIVSDMVVYTLAPRLDPVKEMRTFFEDERRRIRSLWLNERWDLLGGAEAIRQAGAELVNWLAVRLPELGHRYIEEASRLELVYADGMRYARRLAVGAALAFATAKVAIDRGAWASFGASGLGLLVGRWGWELAGLSLFAAFILGRLQRRLLLEP
jgi:ubiquinone biosynthesis protein